MFGPNKPAFTPPWFGLSAGQAKEFKKAMAGLDKKIKEEKKATLKSLAEAWGFEVRHGNE